MDLLTTILACSLYASDDALVRAIAEGPSGKNPYLVLDAAVDPTQVDPPPAPKTESEAMARAQELLAQSGRPLLGLLELPPAWLDVFGRDLPSAFDPCTNIAVGTAMLSEFDFECGGHAAPEQGHAAALERTNRRACVLRKYEAATGSVDFESATLLELSFQRPVKAEIEAAPIFAPEAARSWGPDQLLVRMPLAIAPPSPAPASVP
jgi:hypothetical protein